MSVYRRHGDSSSLCDSDGQKKSSKTGMCDGASSFASVERLAQALTHSTRQGALRWTRAVAVCTTSTTFIQDSKNTATVVVLLPLLLLLMLAAVATALNPYSMHIRTACARTRSPNFFQPFLGNQMRARSKDMRALCFCCQLLHEILPDAKWGDASSLHSPCCFAILEHFAGCIQIQTFGRLGVD